MELQFPRAWFWYDAFISFRHILVVSLLQEDDAFVVIYHKFQHFLVENRKFQPELKAIGNIG